MIAKILAPLIIVGAVLAFAGCDKTLQTDSIEPQIKDALKARGVNVTTVDCPSDVTAKKGKKFECTVKGADGSDTIEVTQTDDSGHVVFQPSNVKLQR